MNGNPNVNGGAAGSLMPNSMAMNSGNASSNSNANNRNHFGMSMVPQPTLMASNSILTVGPYKHRKDLTRESVLSKYQIIGYIAAGTYGKVYKAKSKKPQEKEGDEVNGSEASNTALYNRNEMNQTAGDGTNHVNGNNVNSFNASNNHPGNNSSTANYNPISSLHLNQHHVSHHLNPHYGHNKSQSQNPSQNQPQNINQQQSSFQTPAQPSTQLQAHLQVQTQAHGQAQGQQSSNTANQLQQGQLQAQGRSITTDANSQAQDQTMRLNQHHQVPGSSSITDSNSQTKQDGDKSTGEPGEQLFAIKKFKNDNHSSNKSYNHDINGNEIIHYTGISQSAIREMSICRELNNKNITKTMDILLENKSIYIVSEFCEHDLLQIIHYHSHPEVRQIPERTTKSLIWQILNGVLFLHKNWIFHRDLKPANIMVTSNGVVKIGDLGLARKFNNPLQSLYTGDKVVVTIWYRAPELLLGTRNYTPSIDLWAVGCILAELLSLRPIFKGEEAKMDINNKKSVPFQTNQFQKIVEILGTPTPEQWPSLNKYPEYVSFKQQLPNNYNPNLATWYKTVGGQNKSCLLLLKGLLEYDPIERLTAENALVHPYFLEQPKVCENAFEGLSYKYPKRRIYTDDNDIISGMQGGKRHGFDESKNRKRQR
ncbi:serine/threonine-protein kinase Ssn3p [[Candida] railenensis]|uniref:Cyclin-dependent kinase 8 n=1 Tax=[Candida] railenensis TaxID=45579 RepID=A0A9P0QP02_9ASCO|nr:serine/threonine-protein kinase Ssn3p [[Candida] railenensis]